MAAIAESVGYGKFHKTVYPPLCLKTHGGNALDFILGGAGHGKADPTARVLHAASGLFVDCLETFNKSLRLEIDGDIPKLWALMKRLSSHSSSAS